MLASGPAHSRQRIGIFNVVLPSMVRYTWKPHLVLASLETLKFIPGYVLDAEVKQSTPKVLMIVKGVGKLQLGEISSVM